MYHAVRTNGQGFPKQIHDYCYRISWLVEYHTSALTDYPNAKWMPTGFCILPFPKSTPKYLKERLGDMPLGSKRHPIEPLREVHSSPVAKNICNYFQQESWALHLGWFWPTYFVYYIPIGRATWVGTSFEARLPVAIPFIFSYDRLTGALEILLYHSWLLPSCR